MRQPLQTPALSRAGASPGYILFFTAPETEPQRPGTLEQPRLGQLSVAETTPDSVRLYWTVAKGPFDSFLIQYKDVQGRLREVPVRGDENVVTIPDLEAGRKYRMDLYGLRGGKRMGPVSVVATTGELGSSPLTPQSPTPVPLSGTYLGLPQLAFSALPDLTHCHPGLPLPPSYPAHHLFCGPGSAMAVAWAQKATIWTFCLETCE